MAKQAQHKQKWLHNRAFLETIADDYPDWKATVMFYVALHIVEVLFARDDTRPHSSHAARNETLKTVHRKARPHLVTPDRDTAGARGMIRQILLPHAHLYRAGRLLDGAVTTPRGPVDVR